VFQPKEFLMVSRIKEILSTHVVKPEMIDSIQKRVADKHGKIIEVIGSSGTGKSYIARQLTELLATRNCLRYSPRVFRFNQVYDLLHLLTGLSEKDWNKLIAESKGLSLKNKFDFFFFLTEHLKEKNVFKPAVVLIDDCTLLDQYTVDFIHYLDQYIPDKQIFCIVFTNEPTFLFSEKIELSYLSGDDILQVLTVLFEKTGNDLTRQSQILRNITSGNIFLIEYLLSQFFQGGKQKKFNLSNFLDEKLTVLDIFRSHLEGMSPKLRDLLINIFILDGSASADSIPALVPKGTKLKNDLETLIDEGWIEEISGNYLVSKPMTMKQWFMGLPSDDQKKWIRPILKATKEAKLVPQALACLESWIGEIEYKDVEGVLNELTLINDQETLRTLYNQLLERTENPAKQVSFLKQLGLANISLNNMEASAENYRQALRVCTNSRLPAEEIVYHLANSLYSFNSSAFALEIIKKYFPHAEDPYWRAQMLLLQSEIQQDLENFEEAFVLCDEAANVAGKVNNERERSVLISDCRKIKGKACFYSNQWDKAETLFKEAEVSYRRCEHLEGQAAVLNNLGVLCMQRGEWDKAEEWFIKSLEQEKLRYNLNGISVCYNNLGGLLEDKGDNKKSLYYLYEALHIQKLLSDRYNITNIYNNIGITFMDNGEYDKAAEAMEMSLQTALNFNLFRNIIVALNNLGALYFKSGKWMKAIEYYERAIERSKENNFLEGLCKSYNNIGELYEKRGEYTLAYDLYFKGLELLPDVQDEILKAELSGNLGSVLTHLHQFGKAYAYLVESYDFFKGINAKDRLMIEACQKMAHYFIQTRNFESANYYLNSALKMASDLNNKYEEGNTLFLKAMLERKDQEKAQKLLEQTIEIFVETKSNFELAQANYEYASILNEKGDWEQALQILQNNKKLIKDFEAIKFLEKNDVLIQKIMKEHAIELKESRTQESLMTRFYEITQNLNQISDFDVLLETALDSLVDLSEGDGGILCLYNSRSHPESWEYQVFNHFSSDSPDYDFLIDIVHGSFTELKTMNIKQPHEAPQYNNIVAFPLSIRANHMGVILLFARHGAHYFTEKMVNLLNALCNQIVVIIENIRHTNLAKSHAIIREELNTANPFSNIIGKSEKIQEIFQIIEKIKDTPTTVLLEGQSGTGKELIARAIHYTSNRRNKKFVAQYCGALPETLLESELFGHVKGAFTGAAYDKKGLFEIADGGTFFLDEIADISLSTQAKLLRFLQEGEIKRVGSTKTMNVDVRVICATNVSLIEKVKRDEFRLDLYYRLNVIKIKVPSLKERKSDIPLLAIHFLDKYNTKMVKNVLGITDEAMKYLMNCDWPGNIRQLENEIERAVTLAENDAFIKPGDLSEEVFKYVDNVETVDLLGAAQLKDAVEDLERKMILKALEERAWNQTQAAKDLGLSRQGLIKKIRRYALEQ
jgi:Nif-specific regulatory protein